jgi:hypothetical protein
MGKDLPCDNTTFDREFSLDYTCTFNSVFIVFQSVHMNSINILAYFPTRPHHSLPCSASESGQCLPSCNFCV